MWTWAILLFVSAIIAVWVLWGRCWLKERPWAWSQAFFRWIEPVEILLYKKSETILWARWRQFAGYLVAILLFVGGLDASLITMAFPEHWQKFAPLVPLAISLSGHMAEFLRDRTTKPIEIVALPEHGTVPLPVVEAVVKAEVAKEEAVAAVKEAKAEGNV